MIDLAKQGDEATVYTWINVSNCQFICQISFMFSSSV